MSIIGLFVFLVVACALVWGARAIMAAFGVKDPIATVIYVFLVLLLLGAFLNYIGYGPRFNIHL